MKAPLLALLVLAASGCQNHPSPSGADGGSGKRQDSGTESPPQIGLSVNEDHFGTLRPHTRGWVLGKDGDGDWKVLEGADGGYPLEVRDAQGRYTVAVACGANDASATRVFVYQSTVEELPAPRINGCMAQTQGEPLFDVTLVIEGMVPDIKYGQLNFAGTGMYAVANGSYPIKVPAGVYDTTLSVTSHYTSEAYVSDRFVLHHGLLVNAAVTETVDVSQGLIPEPFTLNFGGASAADLHVAGVVFLRTPTQNGRLVSQSFDLPHTLGAVPLAALAPGDLQLASLIASGSDARTRGVYRTFRQGLPLTLTPPPYLTSGTVTNLGTAPEARPAFTWSGVPEGSTLILKVVQGSKEWTLMATPKALTGNSAAMPSLSALPGYDPSSGLTTGVQGYFSIRAGRANADANELFAIMEESDPSTDGVEVGWVERADAVTF